jgi:antitoxin MazE
MRDTTVMKIERWDDSLVIRLPPEMAAALGLQEGDDVEISIKGKTPAMAETRTAQKRLELLRQYRGLLPADIKIERDPVQDTSMAPRQTHPSETFCGTYALAAIGEAMLVACRGDKARIDLIRKEACRYIAANPVLKALTHLCEDAAENADWTLPDDIGNQSPGRACVVQFVDELFARLGVGDGIKMDTLSPSELRLLSSMGALGADEVSTAARAVDVDTAAEFGVLMAGAVTLTAFAKSHHMTDQGAAELLLRHAVYGVQVDDQWLLPRFQFGDDHLPVPGFVDVLPYLPPDIHPLAVIRFFTTPSPDLVLDDEDEPLCPIDWLKRGLPAVEVRRLLEDL